MHNGHTHHSRAVEPRLAQSILDLKLVERFRLDADAQNLLLRFGVEMMNVLRDDLTLVQRQRRLLKQPVVAEIQPE